MFGNTAFGKTSNWYKGNLHSHTTLSDGRLTPQEAVELYRRNGYAFLCLSDHDVYTDFRDEFDSDDFILLPGLECSCALDERGEDGAHLKVHHVNALLGTREMQERATRTRPVHMERIDFPSQADCWDGTSVLRDMIASLRERGFFVTYNHPLWSRVEVEEFQDVEGIAALEIFNNGCEVESADGRGTVHWDAILRRGRYVPGFASDDNHNARVDDSLGGWISVNADRLSHDDIVDAILQGRYYSSCGPTVHEWGIRNGEAFVTCSAVNRINFIAGNRVGDGISILGQKFEDCLNEGTYKLRGHERYIRAECVDRFGRTAWTNPIML